MTINRNKFVNAFVVFALLANIGLFCSTAIQVGFAHNLGVPSVPANITMAPDEAFALPGLAARDWAAGACVTLAMVGALALFGKFSRRTALALIAMVEFTTLLPIIQAHFGGRLPAGADWIFMHHCISGGLALIAGLIAPAEARA
ncbi:hypothetical protein [Chromobacterium paludis]|uniref:Uncharacterized protein n=1 Tax=Chromobacterium paludis TaxID=2605945 RepID=A0A5C1DIX3_9NEIS|nr:hypothetical protein [Chromobacterium paludis]QEL55678.1 hypothetical protein FYK34_08900 [Chromobacterium paludis]